MVSIVHDPNLDINSILSSKGEEIQTVHKPVDADNLNYFKVNWKDGIYPNIENNCAENICEVVDTGCLCSDFEVNTKKVFKSIPSTKDIVTNLHVGGVPPQWYDSETYNLAASQSGVEVYQKNGEPLYGEDTIFGLTYRGEKIFLKNCKSTINVSTYEFRNPPQFLNIAKPDTRDAMYETEAVLDHYFYHKNTAPFLATRLIQRFGISNPSPRYTKVVAQAFVKGKYKKGDKTFGSGSYGDLGAMVAAIVLDREARDVLLDEDPSSGSLREPLIKVISFLRSMEYENVPEFPALTMLGLQDLIGQEVNSIPNVFSFFLPEFAAPGKVADAQLTAPEAQGNIYH